MNQAITVSNSEVISYQTCKRRHYYHHGLGIEPRIHSIPLDRGNTGHKALELYYKAKIAGADKQEAITQAVNYIFQYSIDQATEIKIANNLDFSKRMKMYNDLITLIQDYANRYWNDNVRPIEIETVHKVALNDRLRLGLKIDLFGEYIKGPFKGDYTIIDWKFRYNFPQQKLLDILPQIPKYIWAIGKTGTVVTKGELDVIRYRSLVEPDEYGVFKRFPLHPKPRVRDKIIEDHITVAEEIYKVKQLPVAEYSKIATRTLSEYTCKDCPFIDICSLELRGEDPTLKISTDYKPSDYNYDIEVATEVTGF